MSGWPYSRRCSNARPTWRPCARRATPRAGAVACSCCSAARPAAARPRSYASSATECDRVLWGACDPLFTPRPLGPFTDIAQDTGGELRELLAAGAKPHQVAAEIAREAGARQGIMVLEDLHWADEATLDVLSLLGRRIGALPIARHRHLPRRRTGPGAPAPPAARRSCGHRHRPPAHHRATVRGRPSPRSRSPTASTRTSCTAPRPATRSSSPKCSPPAATYDPRRPCGTPCSARAARLDEAATTVVEAVSIAVPQCELQLLDALVDGRRQQASSGRLSAGILEVVPGGVRFRHELARRTIEESLQPAPPRALHRTALQTRSPAGDATPAGPPRRGGRRRRGGPALRARGGRAGRRDRRAPRGGRPLRPGAAVRRRAAAGDPGRPARAPVAGVLPHRPDRRVDHRAGAGDRGAAGGRRPAAARPRRCRC